MLQLSEEINQRLEGAAPLIAFFGLSEQEQIAVLPVLEKRKYDFPDGDLITSSALEVLLNGYKAYLNAIYIRLMIMQDESTDTKLEEFVDLVDKLLGTTQKIEEEHPGAISHVNYVRSFEWENLRQLSSVIQQKLEIQLVINSKIMKDCIEYWLHP